MGWIPVVLCDLWRGAATNRALLEAVPDAIPVIRDYTRRARAAWRSFEKDTGEGGETHNNGWWSKIENHLPDGLRNTDLLPLSDHGVHIPYSLRSARRLLSQFDCQAIVVNADPFEGVLVGARVAAESGLPLLLDFRDPWSVCELRRPKRPRPTRWLVDRFERYAVEIAHTTILNTETMRNTYLEHYQDIDPARFEVIRNHTDPELTGSGSHPGFDRFSVLFLGHFRQFVEGDVLLRALNVLVHRGVSTDALQLVVTGNCPESTLALARSLGVADMLHLHPFVPYTEIGAIMKRADLLLLLNNRSVQRIPAKFYDYTLTDRPILAVADNPELAELVESVGGHIVPLDAAKQIADVIQAEMARGRGRRVDRGETGFTSREASLRLAELLDRATD